MNAADIAFNQLILTQTIRYDRDSPVSISDPELLDQILNILVEYFDNRREDR